MRHAAHVVSALARTAFVLVLAAPVAAAPPERIELFDGETLDGWRGDRDLWSVRDGAIVGNTEPNGIDSNTFLVTEDQYENFILRLEFRWTGGNSGVQFRSEYAGDPEDFEIRGYQADIGDGFHGSLYDERRRGMLAASDVDWVLRFLRKGEWNRYEIRAIGNRVELRVNGLLTARYIEKDDEIPREGRIALQLHAGDAMEIAFRDITLEPIEPKRVLFTTHAAGYAHKSRPKAREVIQELGHDSGRFEAVVTDDLDRISPEGLEGFDAVGFYTSGDLDAFPLSEENREFLIEWVKSGKGFFGTHSATDTYKDWEPYREMIGGSFAGHPWGAGSPPVKIDVEDPSHPSVHHLENHWRIQDEIYQIKNWSRDRVHVILSLNPIEHERGTMSHGDYPVAWCRRFGEGKVFYTSLGHREDVWTNPVYQEHLLGGILSVLGVPGYEANWTPGRPKPSNDWTPLFDGRTLSGWRSVSERGAEWTMEDGILKGRGGQGHLFSPKSYRNFHYRATARVFEDSNSGMYFRAQLEERAWPRGMEAQVNSSHGDPKRTGTLYGYEAVYRQLAAPGEWFTQEVIAVDEHVVVKVNGEVTVYRRVPFEDGKHFREGRFAFQQHHEGSKVDFKDVEVRVLP